MFCFDSVKFAVKFGGKLEPFASVLQKENTGDAIRKQLLYRERKLLEMQMDEKRSVRPKAEQSCRSERWHRDRA